MIRTDSPAGKSTKTRAEAPLNRKLDKHLAMYAAAATAAGVGLFAAPGAQAEIVYTPTHVKMDQVNGFYPIDFDNNGVVDVGIWLPVGCSSGGCAVAMSAYPNSQIGNGVVLTHSQNFVKAMFGGSEINQHRRFLARDWIMGAFETHRIGTNTVTSGWVGPWANGGNGVKGRYLGVKFAINGEFHYGWLRISFVVTGKGQFYGVLSGYAYETVPNQPLKAGQTKGADGSGKTAPTPVITPTIERPTLGHLAAGSRALSRRRTQRSAENSQ
jgi:hypothetical protein